MSRRLRILALSLLLLVALPIQLHSFTVTSSFPASIHRVVPSSHHHAGRFLLKSTTAAPASVNGAKIEEVNSSSINNSNNQQQQQTAVPNIRLNVNEKARTVTSVCTSGTLCTVSYHEGIQGAPFGSFVDYVLDDQGSPVLLMNDMSMHTINLLSAQSENGEDNALVTLFCQLGGSSGSGRNSKAGTQDVSRCSLTGTLQKIPPSAPDMDALRMRYSLTHAYADQVMDSPKFSFYRLVPSKIYFVGGFGVLAKWVEPGDYQLAAPDILAKEASDIVSRVNREHTEDLQLTAEHLLGVETTIEEVKLTNVDRLGMDIRVTSQMGTRRNKLVTDEFRVGFRIPVISTEDAKSEILKVFQEAWEKGNGFTWDDDEATDAPGSDVPILKIAADSLE
jgi:heme iron utilization protein